MIRKYDAIQGVLLFAFFVLHCNFAMIESFIDPLSMGMAGLAAVGSMFSYETCTSWWIEPNITGMRNVFRTQLHGQHLVSDITLKAINGHFKSSQPSKALVLSFHGWTGVGKNFVTKIIAEHMYKNGMDSKFVHFFVADLHFPHTTKIGLYQDQLRLWITGNVSNCGRSLFIFDEVDKMQKGIIDVVRPFITQYSNINGINFKKSIFIFLSNAGGIDIARKTLEHWKMGKRREELTRREMERVLELSAFNEEGGLQHSRLIEKCLVSAFVPFLPLERQHVKLCIEDDLRAKGYKYNEDIISKVADELLYFPPEDKLFSKSGCKRVSQKVDLIVEDLPFYEDGGNTRFATHYSI